MIKLLPDQIKTDDSSFENFQKSLNTIEARGYLNTRKLLKDKKIQLSPIPFTTEWIKNGNATFTGQLQDNLPCGYVMYIYANGEIFEGFHT